MINQVFPRDEALVISSTKQLATLDKLDDDSLWKFPLIVSNDLLTFDTLENMGLGILGT